MASGLQVNCQQYLSSQKNLKLVQYIISFRGQYCWVILSSSIGQSGKFSIQFTWSFVKTFHLQFWFFIAIYDMSWNLEEDVPLNLLFESSSKFPSLDPIPKSTCPEYLNRWHPGATEQRHHSWGTWANGKKTKRCSGLVYKFRCLSRASLTKMGGQTEASKASNDHRRNILTKNQKAL